MFGVPFMISPEEAEAQCVALQRAGLADLVASDDSDVWPFGAQAVCRSSCSALLVALVMKTEQGDRKKAGNVKEPCTYRLEDDVPGLLTLERSALLAEDIVRVGAQSYSLAGICPSYFSEKYDVAIGLIHVSAFRQLLSPPTVPVVIYMISNLLAKIVNRLF
ncbi:hypothetical protein AHF37_12537 [Paragonimus kellicotti]|nr:hypothetical protein AHF37_12537 [Paragonimus kellicotti]